MGKHREAYNYFKQKIKMPYNYCAQKLLKNRNLECLIKILILILSKVFCKTLGNQNLKFKIGCGGRI